MLSLVTNKAETKVCYSAFLYNKLDELSSRYQIDSVAELWQYLDAVKKKNPNKVKLWSDQSDGAFFPQYYAPVIHQQGGRLVISPMRYAAFLPPHMPPSEAKRYSTFNARRDNLSSPFWSHAYRKHHGILLIHGFREWVDVKSLLGAGVVSIASIRQQFQTQQDARREKWIAAGKAPDKWKPTKTELTRAEFRSIVIEFTARDEQVLRVPVIFSEGSSDYIEHDRGFAIITDDPVPEVARTGHDRTPIALTKKAANAWLGCAGSSVDTIQGILSEKEDLTFRHGLPLVA